MPTARRDLLSMDQNATLGLLVYAGCVAGPQHPGSHQQVQSVYGAHLITGGPLPVLEQGLWTNHCGVCGGPLACRTTWAHRHLQHLFYNP